MWYNVGVGIHGAEQEAMVLDLYFVGYLFSELERRKIK